jgi:membrane fusion protein, multidrug efflux system
VKSSNFIAAAIVVVVSLWMLSGMLKGDEMKSEVKSAPVHKLTRVQVVRYEAQTMQREILVQGQSEAKHEVVVRAQTTGQVQQVLADQGDSVKRGDNVLRLDTDTRELRLQEARSLVAQRQLEFEAARKLKREALQTERQLAEAETLLHSASTQLKAAELDIQRQNIVAPFSGMVAIRHAEVGDYLKVGDPAYTLVSLNPLVFRGDVAENQIDRLKPGLNANVELSNGATMNGKLTFIASVADSATRTYAIEIEAANPDFKQRAGMSATIHIPLDSTPAHKVSPALLSLNDAGVLGLKIVEAEDTVHFYAVDILKAERDGVWLGGLPQSIDLITVGQGFVRDGEKVEVARQEAS